MKIIVFASHIAVLLATLGGLALGMHHANQADAYFATKPAWKTSR